MTSSLFRGNIPFRPTPQTCYPPPPPPLDPDIVPCIGTRFGSYASITIDTLYVEQGGFHPDVKYPPATNLALLTLAPGLRQWTSRITLPGKIDLEVGIRCWGELYGNFGWQTALNGRTTMPDGFVATIKSPWATAGQVDQLNDGHRIHISWNQVPNATYIGPIWILQPPACKLVNQPDSQRSRPPNPPLPNFGLV